MRTQHEHDDWADGDCTRCIHEDEVAIAYQEEETR
jgi:hypothetical protein